MARNRRIPGGNGSAEAEAFREKFSELPVMTPDRIKEGR